MRTVLIAKGRQVQNHTLHPQVKAHRSGRALVEAGPRGGLSVTPVPRSGPGLWGSIRQRQPGHHTRALPSWQSRHGSAEAPPLCSCLTVHAFSSPGSGLPARASRGQQRAPTFSLKEKMFQKRAPPWGGLTSVGDGEEADLGPDNQAPLLSFHAPECEHLKRKTKKITFFLLHSNTLK